MNGQLIQAQEERNLVLLDQAIDRSLDLLLSAKTVGPRARVKLRFLLRYYAKKRHPFRACVRDNLKRFGPGRTEEVCATLKDIIRGTTKWRGKNNPRDVGTPGLVGLFSEGEESPPEIDEETLQALDQLSELDLAQIFSDAQEYLNA